MANVTEIIMMPGKSNSDIFEAAKKALPKAGFEVWKLRDIAWMVLAKGTINNISVDANVMARPGGSAAVTAGAEGLGEAELRAAAQRIIEALKQSIG